jgi:hypothetical protein
MFQRLEGWVTEGTLAAPQEPDCDDDTLGMPLKLQLAMSRERNRQLEGRIGHLNEQLAEKDQSIRRFTLQGTHGPPSAVPQSVQVVEARLQAAQNLLAERDREVLSLRKKLLEVYKKGPHLY